MQSSHSIKQRLQTLRKTVQPLQKASDEKTNHPYTTKHHKTPQGFELLWNRHLSSVQQCTASLDITDSSLQLLHKYFNLHSYKT